MVEKEVRMIDANALDTLLEDVEKGYKKNFLFKSAKELRWIRDAISALRTIDPETLRPKGKWETDKEDVEWGNHLKKKYCTNCGKRPHYDKEKGVFILTAYCPNCGAKMEG